MSGNQNKDYAVSKFLTSPVGKALGSAATTGVSLLALRRLMKTKAGQNVAKKLLQNKSLGGPSNKSIATTAALSGGLSGVFANAERDMYANALSSKLLSGRGGFTKTEKELLVGNVRKGTGKKKGFSEHYISPMSHGAGRAALGFLFGGPSGAAVEALSGAAGTVANRQLWARALAGRSKSGDLTSAEKRLVNTLKAIRAPGGRNT